MSSDPEIEFLGTSIAIRTLPAQSYQYVSSSSRPFSSSTTAIDLTSLSDSDEDTTINRPFSSTSPTALKAAPYAKASIPINYGTSKTKLLGKQRANELSLYAERRAERAQSNWPGEQQPAPTHDIQPSLAENGLSPQLSTDGADASRTVDGYHKRPASTSARAIQNRTAYEIIELSDSDDPPPTPRKVRTEMYMQDRVLNLYLTSYTDHSASESMHHRPFSLVTRRVAALRPHCSSHTQSHLTKTRLRSFKVHL